MHDNDRFDGIYDFVAAVRLGSFAAVAAERGVTASGVGKSVSRLEARLGTKLLHRTTRRLTLTQDGSTYYAVCLQVLDDLDESENGMSTGHQSPTGRLRVDLPAYFGRRHVMPTLIALSAKYPRIDLSVTFTERKVNLVDEGVDLAVRIGSLDNDADLVARRLGTQRLVICAAPSYLEKHGVPESKDELTQRDCIVGWRSRQRATWLMRESDGTVLEQPVAGRHEFGDGEAMLAGVLAGCGLCQLPTWLVREQLLSGSLVPVLGQYEGAEMPINLIWPVTRYIKPKMRAAIDVLAALAAPPNPIFHPQI